MRKDGPPERMDGPTDQRLEHADNSYDEVGRGKATRFTMYDDALGKAYRRRKLQAVEYCALQRYAYHWAAGGLQSPLQSVDLDRIFAFNPTMMSGLAKTERQTYHRAAYHAARAEIGTRPAYVADSAACFDIPIATIGVMLGYRSAAHGREATYRILSDAGYRLGRFFKELDR